LSGQLRRQALDEVGQLLFVDLELVSGVADGEGETTCFAAAHQLLDGVVGSAAAPADDGQPSLREGSAGKCPISVITGEQQRPEPIDLPGPGSRQLHTRSQQDPERLALGLDRSAA
jgi:hypothetical protein